LVEKDLLAFCVINFVFLPVLQFVSCVPFKSDEIIEIKHLILQIKLVPNPPTSLGKRERQGAPSHCPPDSVPLAPRQERSPALPFPLISGVFALVYILIQYVSVAVKAKIDKQNMHIC